MKPACSTCSSLYHRILNMEHELFNLANAINRPENVFQVRLYTKYEKSNLSVAICSNFTKKAFDFRKKWINYLNLR